MKVQLIHRGYAIHIQLAKINLSPSPHLNQFNLLLRVVLISGQFLLLGVV